MAKSTTEELLAALRAPSAVVNSLPVPAHSKRREPAEAYSKTRRQANLVRLQHSEEIGVTIRF